MLVLRSTYNKTLAELIESRQQTLAALNELSEMQAKYRQLLDRNVALSRRLGE